MLPTEWLLVDKVGHRDCKHVIERPPNICPSRASLPAARARCGLVIRRRSWRRSRRPGTAVCRCGQLSAVCWLGSQGCWVWMASCEGTGPFVLRACLAQACLNLVQSIIKESRPCVHYQLQFDQPVELAVGAELTRNKGAKGEAWVGKACCLADAAWLMHTACPGGSVLLPMVVHSPLLTLPVLAITRPCSCDRAAVRRAVWRRHHRHSAGAIGCSSTLLPSGCVASMCSCQSWHAHRCGPAKA